MSARLAVIGAGPIGLEAALAASDAGFDVRVYESGPRVGWSLFLFGDLPLFTPFGMNSTEATRARLCRAGVALPSGDAIVTAQEFAERYLDPIATLPELRGRIFLSERVKGIVREGLAKSEAIASTGDPRRASRSFVIQLGGLGELPSFDEADIVVDASGIASWPRATGPGGLSVGEWNLGNRIDHRLLPSLEETRERYGGRRALLIGSGHSAATALVAFDTLARAGSGPERIIWICRDRGAATPFPELPDDPLPARAALVQAANRVAMDAPWLERRPGTTVLAYKWEPTMVQVKLRPLKGPVEYVEVDRVCALAGFHPDTSLFRELQVHLCYASEAPMALASALLAARSSNPARAGDCLAQTTHGAETLRTTEPGFFVLGAKSYGRNPDFLMRVGYEQVGELMTLLTTGFSAPVAAG